MSQLNNCECGADHFITQLLNGNLNVKRSKHFSCVNIGYTVYHTLESLIRLAESLHNPDIYIFMSSSKLKLAMRVVKSNKMNLNLIGFFIKHKQYEHTSMSDFK